LGGRDRQIFEFKASLIYKVRYRTARTKQRSPVLKTKKKKKKKIFFRQAIANKTIETLSRKPFYNKIEYTGKKQMEIWN
jgi:hypothetical protein